MKGKYRKAVFIVTYRKENYKNKDKILYLLLKRKLHWTGWEFPKGGRKEKESIAKTIVRELKEETGQNAENICKYNYHGRYKYDRPYLNRKGFIGQTFILYSAEIKNKKVKLDRKEHLAYRWLTFEGAIKKLRWQNQKKSLKIVNKHLENKKANTKK